MSNPVLQVEANLVRVYLKTLLGAGINVPAAVLAASDHIAQMLHPEHQPHNDAPKFDDPAARCPYATCTWPQCQCPGIMALPRPREAA